MSAYIVEGKMIDIIVAYFLTPVMDDRLYIKVDDSYVYMDESNAPRVAEILMLENIRSVNSRYNDSFETSSYTFDPDNMAHRYKASPFGRIVGFIDALEYQSCETDDYHETEAYAILCSMRKRLLRNLAEKDGSYEWGL